MAWQSEWGYIVRLIYFLLVLLGTICGGLLVDRWVFSDVKGHSAYNLVYV